MTERIHTAPPANERGISLIELMVVLVVVAIGVLALSAVQTRSSTDVYATGRHTRALQVAQTRMEIARGAGFAAAQTDSGSADGFNWWTAVDSVDVGLRRVNVSVRWSEHGEARSVQLLNLLAKR
ncbi:MAG: prepilin-type N-terminal cleavage/methylation domain-containing protein [Candidatus Eisenbacteria bacterium]|nr:prepilin-type N-terminal cleavage/methylation domain-containing protein [Candidatus Eisenbacteria bacterium]